MPNSNQPSTPPSPHPRRFNRLLLAIATIAFVGFADSAYLTADHYFTLPLPCSLAQGCEVVLNSVYSMVGPIPLALFGVAFYLTVLFLALYLYTADAPSRRLVLVLFCLTVVGLVMSVIFELIQALLIHAFCQYCALSALCSLLLFVAGVALMRTIKRVPNGVS